MHSFSVTRELEHPADKVWALLSDFANTYVYHPIVEASESVNGQRTGLGAQRQCNMYDGNTVQERIVAYRPDDMTYRVEVVDHGPFPLEFMDVEISVVTLERARSSVTYSGNFRPKFGPLGWVMGKAVMQGQFVKMLGQVIEGANSHLSTGRVIEKNGALGAQYSAA